MYLGALQGGLTEFTSDISRLTNLMDLALDTPYEIHGIPESISCLQKLKFLTLYGEGIDELPVGMAMLANLDSLIIHSSEDISFPPNLQVLVTHLHAQLGLQKTAQLKRHLPLLLSGVS
jgi:hypothetical protein